MPNQNANIIDNGNWFETGGETSGSQHEPRKLDSCKSYLEWLSLCSNRMKNITKIEPQSLQHMK